MGQNSVVNPLFSQTQMVGMFGPKMSEGLVSRQHPHLGHGLQIRVGSPRLHKTTIYTRVGTTKAGTSKVMIQKHRAAPKNYEDKILHSSVDVIGDTRRWNDPVSISFPCQVCVPYAFGGACFPSRTRRLYITTCQQPPTPFSLLVQRRRSTR